MGIRVGTPDSTPTPPRVYGGNPHTWEPHRIPDRLRKRSKRTPRHLELLPDQVGNEVGTLTTITVTQATPPND